MAKHNIQERDSSEQPIGVQIARAEGFDKTAPKPMTDDKGSFVNANRNPVPTPNTYRQGLNAPIDTRTGAPMEKDADMNSSAASAFEKDQADQQRMQKKGAKK